MTKLNRSLADRVAWTRDGQTGLSLSIHTMVSLTISLKGKPKTSIDFADRDFEHVTIRELKAAVHAKFPKVNLSCWERLISPRG